MPAPGFAGLQALPWTVGDSRKGAWDVRGAGGVAQTGSDVLLRAVTWPLRGGPLAAVVLFSLMGAFATTLGPFGWIPGVILAYGYASYGLHVLEAMATGRPQPPVLEIDMMVPAGDWRPLVLGALLGAAYAGWRGVHGGLGAGPSALVVVLAWPVIPAVAVLLSVEKALGRALNPKALAGVAWGMGWPFLASMGTAGAVAGGAWWLSATGAPALLWFFLVLLGATLVFSILGAGLYWRRIELGVPTVCSPERDRDRAEHEQDRLFDRFGDEAYLALRGGERQQCYDMLRRHLADAAHPRHAWKRVFDLAWGWEDAVLIGYLGQDYLAWQLAQGHTSEAVDTLARCLGGFPDFRPADGALALRLAALSRQSGRPKLARQLLADFARHFPGHPGAGQAERMLRQLDAGEAW